MVLNGGDKPTGVLVAGQGVGSGNKGIAEAERTRSEAGQYLGIQTSLRFRLLHLVVRSVASPQTSPSLCRSFGANASNAVANYQGLAFEGTGGIGREAAGIANPSYFALKGMSDAKPKPLVSTGDQSNPLLQPHVAVRAIICHSDQPPGKSWLRNQFFLGLVYHGMALYLGH